MSRTDTAVEVISAAPDRVLAALTEPDALAMAPRRTDDWPSSTSIRVPAGPTDSSHAARQVTVGVYAAEAEDGNQGSAVRRQRSAPRGRPANQ
jgi:hypothetical protein